MGIVGDNRGIRMKHLKCLSSVNRAKFHDKEVVFNQWPIYTQIQHKGCTLFKIHVERNHVM